jgi:hypothetical protein
MYSVIICEVIYSVICEVKYNVIIYEVMYRMIISQPAANHQVPQAEESIAAA